jgi:hypothetical protein
MSRRSEALERTEDGHGIGRNCNEFKVRRTVRLEAAFWHGKNGARNRSGGLRCSKRNVTISALRLAREHTEADIGHGHKCHWGFTPLE